MRKLVFIVFAFLLTSCCLSQIPTQYAYVDSNCEATLPDYLGIVIVDDNCDIVNITQIPLPGISLAVTTTVEIVAIDVAGNESSVIFDVVLLDTIPPTIQLNPEWAGYTDQEIGDMYRSFYGWTQLKQEEFNRLFHWDSLPDMDFTSTAFYNIIPVPDSVRDDWWWGTE